MGGQNLDLETNEFKALFAKSCPQGAQDRENSAVATAQGWCTAQPLASNEKWVVVANIVHIHDSYPQSLYISGLEASKGADRRGASSSLPG